MCRNSDSAGHVRSQQQQEAQQTDLCLSNIQAIMGSNGTGQAKGSRQKAKKRLVRKAKLQL